ncbi:hypothetical protein [Mycobacterium parmense]|uniref:Uncharacterized protein n=1 Tax=Mycobacterium parmense TaxID=185642 RepID=A0A7I7Z1P9_9MYCO|nr:hypothetical protein [Mycobacterium parmense]MCV7352180.1 hypothetical protein [Mycobacterium parmense]BBZ48098.1 hypothetical protein MPRM_53790 [Mycobacterium parmense]
MVNGFAVAFAILFAVFVVVAVLAGRQGRANARDGVTAHWEGLRITDTELIEGYDANASRYPLNGLTARVEDSTIPIGGRHERRIHVIVEGPNTAVVKGRKVTAFNNGEPSARKFVTALNNASHQLGQSN